MSHYDIKQALLQQLLTTVNADDVGFENNKYTPDGKVLWYTAYYIPTVTEMIGKDGLSSDEQRGVFQVSVFVAANSDNYDNAQLQAIDALLNTFRYNTNIVYNNQSVDILSADVGNGRQSEAWYQRDISINYLAFTQR